MSNIGNWDEACSIFEKVISTAEKNALPWWLRYSMALLETGRGVEGVAFLQRTLKRYSKEHYLKPGCCLVHEIRSYRINFNQPVNIQIS